MDPRETKTRHVRTDDLSAVPRLSRSVHLEPMQFAIVTLEDGTRRVVANANRVGGVCDDCTEFDAGEIVRAAVFEVVDPAPDRATPRIAGPSDHEDYCNCELCR